MTLRKLLWTSGIGVGLLVSACSSEDAATGDGGMGGSSDAGGSGGSSAGSGAGDTGGTGGNSSGGNSGGNSSDSGGAGGTGTGGSGGDGGTGGSSSVPKPRGADHPPTLGATIDRMGRAAIATALIATFSADSDAKGMAKDAYNAADAEDWSEFADDMRANLAILDGLDENCGNQLLADATETRYAALASILADDRLYVLSTVGECGVYLGLEGEIAGALDSGEGKCGGRMPDDDVIERSYSVLAAGILAGVDDTITQNDKDNSDEFPFLAPPH